MVQYPMTETPGGMMYPNSRMDWNNEVMPEPFSAEQGGRYRAGQAAPGMEKGMAGGMSGGVGGAMLRPQPHLEMRNTVSDESVESPLTVEEAHLGSLKAMLQRNRGNYMVATFLIGTQNTVSWDGIL